MKNSIKIFIVFVLLSAFLPFNVSLAVKTPRYASLRDNKVNMRKGPGGRYPIEWVLTRKNMPVKILREFDGWRQVELFDGETIGWIHKNLLSRQKTAIVIEELKLYKKIKGRMILRVEQGVILKVDHCSDGWCKVEIPGYKGWLIEKSIWGNKN